MSYVCPVCNALEAYHPICPQCSRMMADGGRLMDFFDDYSPYLGIDGMKQVDGVPQDLSEHQCPHVFICTACGTEEQQLVPELFIP